MINNKGNWLPVSGKDNADSLDMSSEGDNWNMLVVTTKKVGSEAGEDHER